MNGIDTNWEVCKANLIAQTLSFMLRTFETTIPLVIDHEHLMDEDEAYLTVWQNQRGERGALLRGRTNESEKQQRARAMTEHCCYRCVAQIMFAVVKFRDAQKTECKFDVRCWARWHKRPYNIYDLCEKCRKEKAEEVIETAIEELIKIGYKLVDYSIERR